MKIICSFVLILLFFSVRAQETVKSSFRSYPVGTTGCKIFLPQPPGEWNIQKSEDGADVYTNSVISEGLTFEVIVVQFVEPIIFASIDEQDALLISYLDFLKETCKVSETVGYGKGYTLPGSNEATGVIDFWEFSDGTQGKIKGWITSSHLAVLIVSGTNDPSEIAITDVFLNGFRLPEQ